MTPSGANFRLSKIGQIAVNAHDLERAIKFYRDVLGMTFLFQAPGMAFLDCGGVRIMLAAPDSPESEYPASIIYYKVDDIHSAHDLLRARGVQFQTEPRLVHKADEHDLWMTFFRDSESNVLALMSEVPRR